MSLIRRILADRASQNRDSLDPPSNPALGLGSWDDRFVDLPFPSARQRLYVVGDVHGRRDVLDVLLAAIERDVLRSPGSNYRLVFLGDYIDRGDDSRPVIDRLIEVKKRLAELGQPPVFLMGNHEELMLKFIDDPLASVTWLDYGGVQTLASYGVGLRGRSPQELREAATRLEAALTPHMTFFRTLEVCYQDGNIFCCHAAVEPELPLNRQPREVLLWGESTFLSRGGPSGRTVVHGHTISPNVDVGRNRIGVDTGAYVSGRLSAVRIDRTDGYAVIST